MVDIFIPNTPADHCIIKELVDLDLYQLQRLRKNGFAPKQIFDIGAHVGSTTALCHELWPEAKISCFEPVKANFELLDKNTEHNNITVYYKALVVTPITTIMFETPCPDESDGSSVGRTLITEEEDPDVKESLYGSCPAVQTYEVDAIFIDEVLPERLDLLKIDCEGYEKPIIKYLQDNNRLKEISYIVGEMHWTDYNKMLSPMYDTHDVCVYANPWCKGPHLFFAKNKQLNDDCFPEHLHHYRRLV